MNRYDILLGKNPPPPVMAYTATAPNLVVDAFGRLTASSKPVLGDLVYVGSQPIGTVYNVDLISNQIEIITSPPSSMVYRLPFTE